MEQIGVRQLQQNAASVVRRVKGGERIEVTDRGRPVALLVPLVAGSPLDSLEAAGRLVRAEGDLLEAATPMRLPRGLEAPSHRLAQLRDNER